jgi:hypothetical protein
MILLFSLHVFVRWSMHTFRSGGGGSRSSKGNLERPNPMKTEYACNSSFSVADDDFAYFGPAVNKCSTYIV